jgi:probable addiction module antidote protein
VVEIIRSGSFDKWLKRLRDAKAKAIIFTRIERLAHGNAGDVKPIGSGITEMRIAFGPAAAINPRRPRTSKKLSRSPRNGTVKMAETFSRFDAADYLTSDEAISAYLEESTRSGDPSVMAAALGTVARARNVSQLARDTGMTREGIYKALSPEGNPAFATVVKVAHAMGFEVAFRTRQTP